MSIAKIRDELDFQAIFRGKNDFDHILGGVMSI